MARLQNQPLVRRNPITKSYTPWVAPDHPSYKALNQHCRHQPQSNTFAVSHGALELR
jgi:hypothetical protein